MQSIGHDLRRGLNSFTLGNYKSINKWLGELKNIDASLKTLDKEFTTNAKLIAGWGSTEGDDLADVCQRMTQLMEEVGLIHQAYSIQHTAHRKRIKSLKTQEMTLDDNRKKKHDLTNQLAKQQRSSKENPIKILELQNALERVSSELLTQELELLQFKRVAVRDAFNAQFDSMIEFGEKMALVAGYGRQITNVIDVGPQEAHRTALYSGAEYTAAAISQVKIAVTSWQPQPIGNPIRPHVAPSQDELAYNRSSPVMYGEAQTPEEDLQEPSNEGEGNHNSGYWDEVQILKVNHSQTSLNDGHDHGSWKQELNDYTSPPDSNTDASPYISKQQIQLQEQQRQLQLEQQRVRQHSASSYSPKPSLSQQHYQNAASNVASTLRQSSFSSIDVPVGGGMGVGGRPFSPAVPRRNDTADMFTPSSISPSPSYTSHQHHQPASYEDSLSSSPSRGYRMGFSDPRDRSRLDRMDNGDLYKSEIGSRYARSPPVIMDEK